MPNIVEYRGENYFVMDVRGSGKKLEYLLDNGEWVFAKNVEIVD